jgi:hypothetical protein
MTHRNADAHEWYKRIRKHAQAYEHAQSEHAPDTKHNFTKVQSTFTLEQHPNRICYCSGTANSHPEIFGHGFTIRHKDHVHSPSLDTV